MQKNQNNFGRESIDLSETLTLQRLITFGSDYTDLNDCLCFTSFIQALQDIKNVHMIDISPLTFNSHLLTLEKDLYRSANQDQYHHQYQQDPDVNHFISTGNDSLVRIENDSKYPHQTNQDSKIQELEESLYESPSQHLKISHSEVYQEKPSLQDLWQKRQDQFNQTQKFNQPLIQNNTSANAYLNNTKYQWKNLKNKGQTKKENQVKANSHMAPRFTDDEEKSTSLSPQFCRENEKKQSANIPNTKNGPVIVTHFNLNPQPEKSRSPTFKFKNDHPKVPKIITIEKLSKQKKETINYPQTSRAATNQNPSVKRFQVQKKSLSPQNKSRVVQPASPGERKRNQWESSQKSESSKQDDGPMQIKIDLKQFIRKKELEKQKKSSDSPDVMYINLNLFHK